MPNSNDDDIPADLGARMGTPDPEALHKAFASALTSLGLPDDFVELDVLVFRRELTRETDRGAALFATAHLEDKLAQVLRAFLVDDTSASDPLFRGTAALATFSARIDVSYLLGLIPTSARRDLHLIRRIRNEFAHSSSILRFDEGPIAARCRELHFVSLAETPRARFTQSAMAIDGIIEAKIRLLTDGRMSRCIPAQERPMPAAETIKRLLQLVANELPSADARQSMDAANDEP